MKQADITPIFKKDNSTKKNNYSPISVLPSTSKIFERIMYKQIYNHMKSILSPLLCDVYAIIYGDHIIYYVMYIISSCARMQAQEACESSCRPESSIIRMPQDMALYCFRLYVQCLRKAVSFSSYVYIIVFWVDLLSSTRVD